VTTFDKPECSHGAPGGTAATCALCRAELLAAHGAKRYQRPPTLLPPGVRPMPRDFRARAEAARRRAAQASAVEAVDARTLQLPLGDRD
jgi:hypothetical protein